ncbi:MAG: hypothetical protein FD165_510 [Gammaproteobacteria bacterium]|nr:MAG: hypothetical protein FD165_510 [Gammaproteobacteria bacterium]TND02228.1 MAG: hypothetical protein FD120_2392 [Gammaproteobacteria bacterium]
MTDNTKALPDFSLAYYSGDRKTGAIAIVRHRNGKTMAQPMRSSPGTDREKALKPLMIGMTEEQHVILLDPATKAIQCLDEFPVDAFPAHKYPDSGSNRAWYMNDGDKESGNDTLNCADKGSSVTVVENSGSSTARYLTTICVGRGHHQASFVYPSRPAPRVPPTAYISNLTDGTITAIGNDPANKATYLRIIATIKLGESGKEELPPGGVPNNSFPHGLVYSPVSGKLYILKNGYGTVSVIDPVSNEIEKTFAFKGHSNLLVTPDGRFIIGRGADRKSDAEHVVATLTVFDVASEQVVDSAKLSDVYISQYYFNADGSKLYLTTSSSGSDAQQANCKSDCLLIFDLTVLPKIKLLKELDLGAPAGSLAFLNKNGKTQLVFSSNSAEGAVAVIDGASDTLRQKISVADGSPHSRILSLAG